jgi:predicted nuclease of predicted toxin-antitoxin system
MRILFDQGTPVPLRRHLSDHTVSTAFEMGWSDLANGDLLAKAESQFDLLITTDQNLRYQQNLKGRKLSILVLPTTNWPEIQKHTSDVVSAVTGINSGGYVELRW